MTTELIEKLEKASEGSRELDCAVFCVIHPTWKPYSASLGQVYEPGVRGPIGCDHYTTSLDAALTLVPENYAIQNFGIWPGHKASVTVLGTHLHKGGYWHKYGDGQWEAKGATPAIALCIAALKARGKD